MYSRGNINTMSFYKCFPNMGNFRVDSTAHDFAFFISSKYSFILLGLSPSPTTMIPTSPKKNPYAISKVQPP